MKMSENKLSCWQCYKDNVSFAYVLNIISDLKRKKISSNNNNILDRMNAGEEHNHLSNDDLREILDYASKAKYVSSHTYNDNVSCRINDKQIDGECSKCGEKLCNFTPETFPGKKEVDYVDRHVFESLAKEVNILRTDIYEVSNKFNTNIKSLLSEISNKDKIINILITRLSYYVNYIKENENQPSNNSVSSSHNDINIAKGSSTTTSELDKLKSANNFFESQFIKAALHVFRILSKY